MLAGHLEDALLILLARAPSAGPPRFSHGVQRTSTPVDVYRPAGVTSSSATVEEGGIEDGSSTTLVAALAFGAARAGNDDGLHFVGNRSGHGRTRAGSGHRDRPDAGRRRRSLDRGG